MSSLIPPHVVQDDDAPARTPHTHAEAMTAISGMADYGELARTTLAPPGDRTAWFNTVRMLPGAAGALRPTPPDTEGS
jgi:hypothetical protein